MAAGVGFAASLMNILNILFLKGGAPPDLLVPTVLHPAGAAVALLLIQRINLRAAQAAQAILVLLIGLIAMEEYPEAIYGHAFLLLGWIMLVQYRLLEGKRLLVATGALLAAALAAISIGIARGVFNLTWVSAFNIIMFDVFVMSVGAVLYRDTLRSYLDKIRFTDTLRRQRSLDRKVREIEAERERYLKRVAELEQQLTAVRTEMKPFPLQERGITPAESEVIRVLVERQCSDADIASVLGKSLATVRVQMRSIFEKLGVESRVQVIELCRYNWD
ncbi:response regulator containing a CheY-like receiver domain and an HTH DNA-binding domain [Spirochaeta africana DSM 8902]|uniref:Response regulator containing a CheY-like receiver domain and an HTH DNA-binding domain n=2 Tax=Spirochaeta TaxID=146 RepID=H9UFG1_SPIAZ|nr:response regulator containing a CheY-like receiver domain and an HTH DNA-binding domain [Spirochaeta africana DSM 8902]